MNKTQLKRHEAIERRLAKERAKSGMSPREAVYAKLWANKKYLRLQAFKDACLRDWNQADAFKNRPSGSHEKAEKADARAKRALARLFAFEKAEFKKAGLDY